MYNEAKKWHDLVWNAARKAGVNKEFDFPRTADAKTIINYVSTQPGPSPWALKEQTMSFGQEKWSFVKSPINGLILLRDIKRGVRLILGFQSYIKVLDSNMLLMYATVGKDRPEGIRFDLIDLNKAKVLDFNEASLRSGQINQWVVDTDSLIASCLIPAQLATGENTFNFSQEFQNLPIYMSVVGQNDKIRTCHYLIYFKENLVNVADQKWFNDSDWDFSYQWISRIVVLQDKSKYFAEVVRGGIAELDLSRKRILRWVIAHSFWPILPTRFP